MSHVLSDIGPCKKRAEIRLDEAAVQEGFDQVYQDICENISFPGFRKGRVPRELVAKKHGKDIVGEVREKLVRDSFAEMLKEENLSVVSMPRFDEKDKALAEGGDFSFSVSFEVRPVIELPDYKGIALVKKVRKVSDAHLEDARKNLLASRARYEDAPADAILEGDDIAFLNLEAKDASGEVVHHKHLFPCSLQHPYLDIFKLDDIAERLKGMKKGEKRSVPHEVPAEFPKNADLAGKKLTLEVEMDSAKRRKSPAFDLDFAKSIGFETLEEVDTNLKKMLEQEFETRMREEMEKQVADWLDTQVNPDLPEDAVKRHADYLASVHVMELLRAGLPREEAESRKAQYEPEATAAARRDIKLGFMLSQISEKEKVFVTEREVARRVVQVAAQRGMAPEKLREELEKNHELDALRDQLKREKVMDLIIEKATVREEEAAS